MSTHDGFYRQVDGLAMGSPPAQHLANGWMSQFDGTIKGTSTLYTRYMDDILTDQKPDEVEDKLMVINELHPSLKFTMERENDGEIPFLDMKVKNEKGNLSSTWYTKPTDTGLVMNFHAMAPKKYKRSVVSGIVHCIYRAYSTWKNIHESLSRAKQILAQNQYPEDFYEPIIHQTLTKLILPPVNNESEDDHRCEDDSEDPESESVSDSYSEDSSVEGHDIGDRDKKDLFKFFVQYRGKCTEHFAKALHNCKAPCRLVMTLRKLKTVMPSLKPEVESEFRSSVVYKISCPRCQACYVGQTVRHLQTRYKEHKTKNNQMTLRSSDFEHTQHCHFQSCY